jgi:ubiquinone/menaquinone biosynthesis C-methylase UbiE
MPHDNALAALPPREGYDRAAAAYDKWYWTEFWRRNEAPLVRKWLQGRTGLGLDAGTGTGNYHRLTAGAAAGAAGQRAIGLDISAAMLREGLADRASAARLIQGDARWLPFRADTFDWILCARMLSHVQSARDVLSEFARVAKAGARMLISDVHPSHPYERVSIATANGTVAIQVYKHAMATLLSEIDAIAGLELEDMREYRVPDLTWVPPAERFEKIFRDPQVPVFYTLTLRRFDVANGRS